VFGCWSWVWSKLTFLKQQMTASLSSWAGDLA